MMTWTPEQHTAITIRDHTVLLSAAAGSGKTAVLTERIIRRLTDTEEPLDLSRLLAVTFTRAAAAELKERIAASLAKCVEEHPHDVRLAHQLRVLPNAKICTIDSFCGDLVRRFATRAGVSDGYRVADQQETDLTRISLMEGLIEDAYAGVVPDLSADDFADFVTRIYALREESGLGETLLILFDRLETLVDGIETLAGDVSSHRTAADTPLMQTIWGQQLRARCQEVGNHARARLERALMDEPLSAEAEEHFAEYLAAHRAVIQTLSSPDTPYAALHALVSYKFPRAYAKKNAKLTDAVKDACASLRGGLLAEVSKFLLYTEEEWHSLLADLATYTGHILALGREFSRRELRESRRRGVYSFAQIERLAYSLLVEHGERTPLALSLAGEYDAVCVDEYQDVSPLQHAVFEALAADRTRFLVGDIKQSIYRFRHADPAIFASLRRTFPSPEDAPDAPNVSLFMSRNFRCDRPVVNYVNAVFDTLFGVAGDSIGYTAADRLTFGKSDDGVTHTPIPVFAVFESGEGGIAPVSDGATLTDGLPDAAHVAGGEENPIDESKDAVDPEDDENDTHREAMWVASRIRDLLDHGTLHDGITPVKPSDIAILLRSKKKKVLPYLAALARYGVPADTPEHTDFFSCPEVLLALSLMRTVDNPRRDIPLTAVLLSPLYRFTADDLVLIRRGSPDGIPLYDALCAFCTAHPDFTRGRAFLDQLAVFRDVAEGTSVDRLLHRLLTETPLMAIAGADGHGGENNLRLLYHYALRYSGGDEGLYNFIHYIDRQIETGKTFSPPAGSGAAGGVTVMTIHSSKGLEFPIVFLADCGKQYSRMDLAGHYVFDGDLPVAYRLRDRSGLVREDNPVHALVCHSITEQNAEEEMRLLYVALTRARERLFLSGTLPARVKLDRALSTATADAATPSRYAVLHRNSYLSLLLFAEACHPESVELLLTPDIPEPPNIDLAPQESAVTDPAAVARLMAEYRRRFEFVYPHLHLTQIPGKLSVSRLTPTLLDGTEEETTYLTPDIPEEAPAAEETDADRPEKYRRMPEAWSGTRPPDPTERGIASHQFMQFCDFDRLANEGVEPELDRLVSLGFLSQADRALVRPEELEKFRVSRLLADMRCAKEVKREMRFHVRLPARDFTTDEHLSDLLGDEQLLVQGVMDAVVIGEGGDITLVDYKTDRLTRAELAHPHLAAEKLTRRHAPQLRYYAAAVEKIFAKRPAKILLYSLHLGDSVELHLDE